MINSLRYGVFIMAMGFVLGGCAVALDVKTKTGQEANSAPRSNTGGIDDLFSGLEFNVYDSYFTDPPKCIAILPFTKANGEDTFNPDITFDQTEVVRRVIYAHLSPHGKRDIEIPRVDHVLGGMEEGARNDLALVGRKLKCDSLITGNVTEYGAHFAGVFSRVTAGAHLKMVRAETGEILWEGEYLSTSNSTSIPLSIIGVAKGIYNAAMNVREASLLKVLDDLGRTLVSSIPDNRIAVLEEPIAPIRIAERRDLGTTIGLEQFLVSLDGMPLRSRKTALIAAIDSGQFRNEDMRRLHMDLIDTAPGDADSHGTYARYLVSKGDYSNALGFTYNALTLNDQDSAMHFLKGRIQIKLDELDSADASIVKAVALDGNNASYLNGLGFLNSIRGKDDRAMAAYQMALDIDPENGFSHYNMGVIYYNAGKLQATRDSFYKAGLAYLKEGDYGQVKKVVADLNELATNGVKTDDELKDLKKALASVKEKELKRDA